MAAMPRKLKDGRGQQCANCCLMRRSTLRRRVAQLSRAEIGFAFNSERKQQKVPAAILIVPREATSATPELSKAIEPLGGSLGLPVISSVR